MPTTGDHQWYHIPSISTYVFVDVIFFYILGMSGKPKLSLYTWFVSYCLLTSPSPHWRSICSSVILTANSPSTKDVLFYQPFFGKNNPLITYFLEPSIKPPFKTCRNIRSSVIAIITYKSRLDSRTVLKCPTSPFTFCLSSEQIHNLCHGTNTPHQKFNLKKLIFYTFSQNESTIVKTSLFYCFINVYK